MESSIYLKPCSLWNISENIVSVISFPRDMFGYSTIITIGLNILGTSELLFSFHVFRSCQ